MYQLIGKLKHLRCFLVNQIWSKRLPPQQGRKLSPLSLIHTENSNPADLKETNEINKQFNIHGRKIIK